MALAARAGIPLDVMYDVVTHAAGNSWMFENRMRHVVDGDYAPKSAVDIFVRIWGWWQIPPRRCTSAAAGLHRFHHVYRRQQRRLR